MIEGSWTSSVSKCISLAKMTIFEKKIEMQFITAIELKTKLESASNTFLLDIREAYERDSFSIPSNHIPMADVCGHLKDLPSNQQVVLICNSGKRAEALANLLETEYNQSGLMVLDGGISAWIDQFGSN